jgi:hypothetical protein
MISGEKRRIPFCVRVVADVPTVGRDTLGIGNTKGITLFLEGEAMNSFNNNLLKYTSEEENVLRARLQAIRTAIPAEHPSEKGRSVEMAVHRFFRDILPNEYGLTTGFIAYHVNECIEETRTPTENGVRYHYRYNHETDAIALSSQLDLIIYDAMRYAPIARIEGCDIVPLEAVFGYVEVKSWIDNSRDNSGMTPLQKILRQSQKLRDMKVKLYWLSEPDTYTKVVLMPFPLIETIPIRAYAFVLSTDESLGGPSQIKELLEQKESRSLNGFLTSMYIQSCGHFWSHHAETVDDPKIGTFEYSEEHPLAAFKIALLASLSRFPRADRTWTLALDRYYTNAYARAAEVTVTKAKGKVPTTEVWIGEP